VIAVDQLQAALKMIGKNGSRHVALFAAGKAAASGFANKIPAIVCRIRLDTVEANLALGFRDDERDYAGRRRICSSPFQIGAALT